MARKCGRSQFFAQWYQGQFFVYACSSEMYQSYEDTPPPPPPSCLVVLKEDRGRDLTYETRFIGVKERMTFLTLL